jgi:hypothetical protein
MSTIQVTPNRSMSEPASPPPDCFSRGSVMVPPTDSLAKWSRSPASSPERKTAALLPQV